MKSCAFLLLAACCFPSVCGAQQMVRGYNSATNLHLVATSAAELLQSGYLVEATYPSQRRGWGVKVSRCVSIIGAARTYATGNCPTGTRREGPVGFVSSTPPKNAKPLIVVTKYGYAERGAQCRPGEKRIGFIDSVESSGEFTEPARSYCQSVIDGWVTTSSAEANGLAAFRSGKIGRWREYGFGSDRQPQFNTTQVGWVTI